MKVKPGKKLEKGMDMVVQAGRMDHILKDIGSTGRLMAEAFLEQQKGKYQKESGRKIRQQVQEYLSRETVKVCLKDILGMMLKMEGEQNYGVMAHIIMVNIGTDRKMEEEYITGQMVPDMQVTGNRMKCTARVSLYGLMEDDIKVNLQWE